MSFDIANNPFGGGLIPPGKFFRDLDWQIFNDATLPSWLTLSGTAGYSSTLSSVATTVGQVNFITNTTINSIIYLQLAHDIRLETFAAVDLMIDGLTFDTDDSSKISFALGIEDWSANEGMRFYQDASNVSVMSLMHNVLSGDTTKVMNYRFVGDGNGPTMKSIGMRVIPHQRGGVLLENGELIGSHFDPTTWVVAGTVKPLLEFKTLEAVSHRMSFSRLRLRLWS